MVSDFQAIAIFSIVAVGFVAAVLTISRIVQPKRPKPEKLTSYECGERPIGQAWSQFNVRYYIFTLVFVIFDIETVLLVPWVVRLKHWTTTTAAMGPYMYWAMLFFLGILVIGLLYEWRKGVLKWI